MHQSVHHEIAAYLEDLMRKVQNFEYRFEKGPPRVLKYWHDQKHFRVRGREWHKIDDRHSVVTFVF